MAITKWDVQTQLKRHNGVMNVQLWRDNELESSQVYAFELSFQKVIYLISLKQWLLQNLTVVIYIIKLISEYLVKYLTHSVKN